MAGRLRRTVTAVTLVALLLPLAAATALADTTPSGNGAESSSGLSAFAGGGQCTTEGDIETCTSINLSLFSGKTREQGSGAVRGTRVCYGTFIDTFNVTTGEFISSIQEFGCTSDVDEGSSIERDLSAATIAPATITLESSICDQFECIPTPGTRDVTVEGTFTATSDANRSSSRNVFDDGFCVYRDRSRGTSRTALFSGIIDGQPVAFGEPDGFAEIMNGTFSSSFSCKKEG